MDSPEPMLDVARGDIGQSRSLARALRGIADTSSDPAMRKQIGELLAGRGSVRDFARTEAFNQLADRFMPAALRKYSAMSEEQRTELAEQGKAELERLRQEPAPLVAPAAREPEPAPTGPTPTAAATAHIHPGTRKPNRDRIVMPDEPDADDLYFQERRDRGYLI